MAAAVQFHDDTLRQMATWAARRYKLGKVNIVFVDGIPGAGYEHGSGLADFQRGRGYIELNMHRTYSKLIQVLAHELAHVVTLKRDRVAGHGPKFRRNLDELISAWNSYAKPEGGAV